MAGSNALNSFKDHLGTCVTMHLHAFRFSLHGKCSLTLLSLQEETRYSGYRQEKTCGSNCSASHSSSEPSEIGRSWLTAFCELAAVFMAPQIMSSKSAGYFISLTDGNAPRYVRSEPFMSWRRGRKIPELHRAAAAIATVTCGRLRRMEVTCDQLSASA